MEDFSCNIRTQRTEITIIPIIWTKIKIGARVIIITPKSSVFEYKNIIILHVKSVKIYI